MKICIINASPKGKYSVTLQSIRYLEKKYSEHEFNVFNISQKIKRFSCNIYKIMDDSLILPFLLAFHR